MSTRRQLIPDHCTNTNIHALVLLGAVAYKEKLMEQKCIFPSFRNGLVNQCCTSINCQLVFIRDGLIDTHKLLI